MKYIKIILLSLLITFSGASEIYEDYDKEAFSKPILVQKGTQKQWCPVCGMNIKKFYKTSHTAQLKNGTQRQYCSMRCLAVDNKKHSINIKTIHSIDNRTEKLITSKDAFYVVDSDIMGTMSKISKLPFSKKEDALQFIEEYDGKLTTFDDALKIANNSLENDKSIDLTKYNQINELKADIRTNKLCIGKKGKSFNEHQLQVTSVYLWEVVRAGTLQKSLQTIKVTKDEKCPICGMYVYKYPRWAAQIFLDDGKHLSFDGVKDLMKYYLKKPISTKIIVTDYYSQKAIDAKKAFYVIGSDTYGPMGHELIPFVSKKDAQTFKNDHKGTKILKFKDISKEEVEKLD
jgi:nitrous oxide reductase accessory protein NosL